MPIVDVETIVVPSGIDAVAVGRLITQSYDTTESLEPKLPEF